MPERKKVRSGIFYLIKILHQPSSGKSIRTTFFSQYLKYCRESTKVLLRKYWSTAKEVLTHLQSVQ